MHSYIFVGFSRFEFCFISREIISRKQKNMGSLMQDFKRQASFFLKEKIKTARLALMDVTPAQILTEELINGESMAPDVPAMRLISKAAFEVDDYERIVQILHLRLSKFDERNWQASYKALILLEHLLTHGPQRISEEFQCDEDGIRDMANFHYHDHKGFDWGLRVQRKSERVIDLMEDRLYLKEARATARKLTVGIKGFGSFNQRSLTPSEDIPVHDKAIQRSQTHQYITDQHHDAGANESLLQPDEYISSLLPKNMARNDVNDWSHVFSSHENKMEQDHPFWDKEHHSRISLLSST